MSFLALLRRSMGQRSGTLSLLSVAAALSMALVVLLLGLAHQAERRMLRARQAPSLIVGTAASPTSLMLATLFLTKEGVGLLKRSVYEELSEHRSTRMAVPVALGDSFRGYPVVATTAALFEPGLGMVSETVFQAGNRFDELADEAVVGAVLAKDLGVRVGDRIEPAHGVEEGSAGHHGEHLFRVVGILTETGSALDTAVVIPLDAFLSLPGHADQDALSAVLVVPKAGMHHAILASELRKRPDVVVAETSLEIARIERHLGSATSVLLAIVGLAAVVAWLGLTATIWATTRTRLRELALLRLAGAGRRWVAGLVLAEGAAIAGLGGVGGSVLGVAGLWAFGTAMGAGTSLGPGFWRDLILGMSVVPLAGALAGCFPAVEVYRRDLAHLLQGRA